MSTAPEGFAAWACDPNRTLEERFGAELLIEITAGLWKKKYGIKDEINYQAEQLRKKARADDPAYEPHYSREDAGHAEEVLPELTQLHFGHFDDRPLRDLSILRFCPALVSIETRFSEVPDWSLLATQPALTKLHLWNRKVRDLRVLRHLTQLQSLQLWLGAPWPDLSGLENLAALTELSFWGNVLAMRDVPVLPHVRKADIQHGNGYNVPLRNLADLPAMPELRRLKLINTDELDGIARYPRLLNLEIYGYYTDLTPMAALTDLTHLFLSGGDYPTLAPLATLPQLRRLIVRHELPPDLTPLADAPRLHEIALDLTHIVPPELASLNAMFNPWSEEFAAPVPRPLAPLKLLLRDQETDARHDSEAPDADWGEDLDMGKSEDTWFYREVNRRLCVLLGRPWTANAKRFPFCNGANQIHINRAQEIDRLPEIVQCLREFLAACRYRNTYMLIIDSLGEYEREMDEIYAEEGEEFDAERQREEWEDERRQERERREFLERKYRHRLQQELGTPAAPLPTPPPGADGHEDEDGDTLAATAETSAPEYDLGTRLHLYATLTEKAVYVRSEDRPLAEMLLCIKAET